MVLQGFERKLEHLVEGAMARVFRSGLQPVELGRRLAREMDLRRTVGVNGPVAPNHFDILLSQADLDRFESFIDALKRELVEAAREHARNERYNFMGPVSVNLTPGKNLSPGMFLVNGQMQESPGGGVVGALSLSDGRRIELGEEPVTIGRLPECDVAIPDPNVSRQHAQVRRLGSDFVLVDMGSTNGTKLNGSWISGERRLNDGDEIGLGATSILFERS